MSRYRNADIIKNLNGKRAIQTWIIETPLASGNDYFIKTTSPERLDVLANKIYNDQSLWYIIAQANGLGKGSYRVASGVTLRIPIPDDLEKYINNINATR